MGVELALSILTLGVLAVPLALLVTLVLIALHHADRSALGILVGMGLLSLCVAYVQRKGPGAVSWHTATASGADEYLDPRPWLLAGILLLAAGVGTFLWRRRRAAA
jgi:hypothetical protein